MKALFQKSQRFLLWLGMLPLALAFVSYRTSSEHIASVQATLATDEFIRQLDELLTTIQDAETGQRGYLLTGQQRYLEPYLTAQSKLGSKFAAMEVLAQRNGISKQQVAVLQHLIDEKMYELRKTLELRQTQGLGAALREVETNRGQQYMTEVRSLIKRWEVAQIATFHQRWEQQHRNEDQLKVVLAIGVFSGIVLLLLAYRFNARYARERDTVEKQIRKLNDDLELRVRERTAELDKRTRELEQRGTELQRSNSDLTHFAYIASHDLQEPLRMVASYMGLLSRRYRGQLDGTADRYIDFAVDGAQRMQSLIQDVLLYSRAGTQTLEKSAVSLSHVVEVALTNLRVAAEESAAVIRYADLPVVQADQSKLTQVVQNLISNAIKFRKSELAPDIVVGAQLKDGTWVISVADNGIGFEAKYTERIFQMFQRLHSIGKYPGNGIGLSICRRIIEHHGGELWADSKPGIGSTFFFTLPAESQPARGVSRRHSEQETGLQETTTRH